ncbi:MAG: helix-turn-helix domain-containing protein [Dehalococcoidales bacterium]
MPKVEMEKFGAYLRSLRTEQRLSLRDVEQRAGVSSSYIAQIERGLRKPPGADILKKLAPVYNVPVRDLLREAGYLEEAATELTEDEEVEMAFQYVMNDPRYKSGTRIKGGLTTEIKRFIVEMYEKATGKKLLP